MIVFLTDRENGMVLSRRKDAFDPIHCGRLGDIELTVVLMKCEGARNPRRFDGLEKAGSISNYFHGKDPSKPTRKSCDTR